MSAIVQELRPAIFNRRHALRHIPHVPAYVSFGKFIFLEVLDIGEAGAAVQCSSQIEDQQQVVLRLSLAECHEQLSVPAQAIWSDSTGRVGLRFPALPDSTLRRLREWLFLNALVGLANASTSESSGPLEPVIPSPNPFDASSASAPAAQESRLIGNDLKALLSLIAVRARFLLRASGAAIALAGSDADTMVCRASTGPTAPPVGAAFEVGSGFSGECTRTGTVFRCDDTDTDERVDRQTCHALGIRSILAVPVRSSEKVVGLFEVFSRKPNAFGEKDDSTLQGLAETISTELLRAPASAEPLAICVSAVGSAPATSLRNEAADVAEGKNGTSTEEKVSHTHRYGLRVYLFYGTVTMILFGLSFLLGPWIQKKLRVPARNSDDGLSSSITPDPSITPAPSLESDPALNSEEIRQLRDLATRRNPVAENAMGLLYAHGDDKNKIKQDQEEAVRWFTKAAEDGSLPAQYKLGLLYWSGHGVPKDANKAYFWAVLASAGGQEGSKDLAKVLADSMTRTQAAAIEQQADTWYQHRQIQAKRSQTR